MKRKVLYYSAAFVFLFLLAGWLVLSTTPPDPKRADTKMVTKMVEEVRLDVTTGDMLVYTEGNDLYYINRALQQNISPDTLSRLLEHKQAEIFVFDKGVGTKHICELRQGGRIIYTELKD